MRNCKYRGIAVLLLLFSILATHAQLYQTDTIASNNQDGKNIPVAKVAASSAPPESVFNQPYVTTPDMAALARNISYPINYSTGTPQISIPLYTIQCGSLTLPLSLTYNASGVRVDDVSGMVGQGWTLTGIPTISRQWKGHIDSQYTCDFQANANKTYEYVEALLDGSNPWSSLDELPDEYYYQLAGKSGMFLYIMEPNDAGLSYASFPYNDVKISLTNTPLQYFTLTDDDGTVYKFDGGKDYAPIPGSIDISGWKASCMRAANGVDSITFSYYDYSSSFTLYQNNDSYTVVDNFVTDGINRFPRIDLYTDFFQISGNLEGVEVEEVMKAPIVYKTTDDYRYSYQVNSSGNLYSDNQTAVSPLGFQPYVNTEAALPHTISFKGNTVTFGLISYQGFKKISSIIVRNSQNQIVRNIKFTYDYYQSTSRSFLKSITFTDPTGNTILEKYSFEYDHPGSLPISGNRGIDFWGYYNGGNKENGGTLVPKMILTTSIDYSGYHSPQYYSGTVNIGAPGWYSRASDEQYMKYGSLKSITYPTGAKDEFTYEANQIKFTGERTESDFYISDHLLPVPGKTRTYYVGGLRIKQIKSIINGDSVNYRTFQYNSDGTGTSPIDECTNYFVTDKRKYYYVTWEYTHGSNTTSSRYRTVGSSPVLPLTFSNGAVVMYSEVTEYNGKGASDNNGKTIYKYSVPTYKWTPVDFSTKLTNKYKDWEYGHLTQKSIYRKDGSGYTLIAKDDYNYSRVCSVGKVWAGEYDIETFTNYYGSSVYPFPSGTLQYMGGTYGYPVYACQLSSQTSTVYDGSGHSHSTRQGFGFSIPYSVQMTEKTATINGETFTENYEHPYHFRTTAPYSTMVAKNVLSPVVTTTSTRNGKTIVGKNPYVANWFKPSALQMNFNNEGMNERISYSYDGKGNKVQASKDGRENVVYLYGYNSQYVVAVIENATYSSVQSVLGSSQISSIRDSSQPSESQWTVLNSLRNNTSHEDWHVTTYRYIPLVGVSMVTDPAGQIYKYDYDALGRLTAKKQVINGNDVTLEQYEYHYKQN